jgi:hypothetical protein
VELRLKPTVGLRGEASTPGGEASPQKEGCMAVSTTPGVSGLMPMGMAIVI